MLYEQHEFEASATQDKQHECDISATGVKNVDFDNDTSEKIFSHLYISHVANERLEEEKQFYSKNYLLEMPRSHVKMRSKNASQKLNFVTAKAISKRYA